MDTKTRIKAIALAVAELRKESGQNFYTAFDTVFASSNFPEYEKEWVQSEVGKRMNWWRQKKRNAGSRPVPKSSSPPLKPRAVQMSLVSIHGYPD